MNFLIVNTKTSIATYFSNYFKNKKEHQIIEFNNDLSSKNKSLLEESIKKNNINALIFFNDSYDIDKCQNNNLIQATTKKIDLIAHICKKNNLPIIYISSYEVYGDINNSIKTENDSCTPLNNLGILSLECENKIRNITKKHFILRTSWLFGDSNCYIKQILNNAHTPLFFCNDKIINPTSIDNLASSIEIIALSTNYGTFNYASRNSCSKLEFTKFIFNFININKEISVFPKEILAKLIPSSKYCGLDISLFESTFNFKLPSWQDVSCDYIISLFE